MTNNKKKFKKNAKKKIKKTKTKDPSVIAIGDTYYMYYGGGNEKLNPSTTRVGIAMSNDNGYTWHRIKQPTLNDSLGATINPKWYYVF